jgi:hypothetical protein
MVPASGREAVCFHSVYATVYRTRLRGMRLPRPQQAVHGRLRLARWHDGLKATLWHESSDTVLVLPELHWAHVDRITTSGIMISGHEIVPRRANNKANADYHRQTWWCLVHTEFLAQVLDVAEPREIPGGMTTRA